ncbi:immunoglobulin superfamily member 11-like [Struthio camelus]|uniref:immunoglobulin superfamily member 11-like n=1 Tax=Struthio camelus TaxID=8801 RepID=UPI003603DE70
MAAGGGGLLLLCLLAGAVRVSVGAGSLRVLRGGSVTLPCSFHTTAGPQRLNIVWTATAATPHAHPQQILAYERGEVRESLSPYTGRVAFASAPTQSATIILNATRASDAGVYQCSVTNPPDWQAPSVGLIRLTVLVPPSSPECSRDGSAEPGGRMRLGCAVREAVPPPTFTWDRVPPAEQPLQPTHDGELRALLTLHNVTAGTAGLYRCTVANALGAASCTLELRVGTAARSTPGMAVGISVTLTMALVLLALFALALWLHHQSSHKQPEEEEEEGSYNEIRIDSFAPGRLVVSKPPAGEATLAPRPAGPLWVFTTSTPCTTYAHRRAADGNQHPPPAQSSPAEGSSASSKEEEGRWLPACRQEHPGVRV